MKSYQTVILWIVLVIYHFCFTHGVLACPSYETDDHRQCYHCGPGFYYVEDCKRDGEQAICRPCPSGYFQRVCNRAKSCQPCSSHCKYRHSKIVGQCSSSADIVCQCEDGRYFLSQVGGMEGVCLIHTQCRLGEGVRRPGTPWQDTICEKCEDGVTFSSVTSASDPCRPCTSCTANNKIELGKCTVNNDTRCGNGSTKDKQQQWKITSQLWFVAVVVFGILVVIFILVLALIFILRKRNRLPRWCPSCVQNTRMKSSVNGVDNTVYHGGIQLEQVCRRLHHTESYRDAMQNRTERQNRVRYTTDQEEAELSDAEKLNKARSRTKKVKENTEVVTYDRCSFSSEHERATPAEHVTQSEDSGRGPASVDATTRVSQNERRVKSENVGVKDDGRTRSRQFLIELSSNLDPKKFNHFYRVLFAVSKCKENDDPDVFISRAKCDYPNDVVEQQYQLLRKWTQLQGSEWDLQIIRKALIDVEDGNAIDILNRFEQCAGSNSLTTDDVCRQELLSAVE